MSTCAVAHANATVSFKVFLRSPSGCRKASASCISVQCSACWIEKERLVSIDHVGRVAEALPRVAGLVLTLASYIRNDASTCIGRVAYVGWAMVANQQGLFLDLSYVSPGNLNLCEFCIGGHLGSNDSQRV